MSGIWRNTVNLLMVLVLAVGAMAVLPGCAKKEGPGEKVGEAVDEAAEETGEAVEKVGEAAQDAAK